MRHLYRTELPSVNQTSKELPYTENKFVIILAWEKEIIDRSNVSIKDVARIVIDFRHKIMISNYCKHFVIIQKISSYS